MKERKMSVVYFDECLGAGLSNPGLNLHLQCFLCLKAGKTQKIGRNLMQNQAKNGILSFYQSAGCRVKILTILFYNLSLICIQQCTEKMNNNNVKICDFNQRLECATPKC